MFKSIGFKISTAIFAVLFTSFIAVLFIINFNFKNIANTMSKANLDTISASVFQTMRMAMNLGEAEKIHEAIEDAKKIEGISDIKIYPSKDTIELFEIKNPQISNENLISEQFQNPQLKSLEQKINNKSYLRLIRPLVADESCIICHANAKLGNVIGVMDIYHSLESIEQHIAKASSFYILIFTLALIATLIVVLFMLRLVVGVPLLRLLNHAKELAQGSGNLKTRIAIKGNDEIAHACKFINQFIEKTQKAVMQASISSKNVENQTKLLNLNANSLNQTTEENYKKIDESFHLGENISSELGELAGLSSDANAANDKSYALLEQMLNSLGNVAQKVVNVVENENELAKKVQTMISQASNIQKTTQMMNEIADKTNLLSLNAGIEAARAGNMGRGFSVIAEDVRNLAQNSEEFVGKVAQITKELLTSINEVSEELKKNAENINSLHIDTNVLVNDAREVKICNQVAQNLVSQCGEKIRISQENIQNLIICMQENVESSEKNEKICKILLQVVDELKIVCNNLENELKQFQI